jgi:hypothetical protein
MEAAVDEEEGLLIVALEAEVLVVAVEDTCLVLVALMLGTLN